MTDRKSVLITGGTGLIGKHLSGILVSRGYQVTLLSRSKSAPGNPSIANWDPKLNKIDSIAVENADIIIHLAGSNIGGGRWTAARKRSISESRVNTCRLLYNAVSRSPEKPELFISASGISYYGVITSDHIFSEDDGPGSDFLANTCMQWEEAAGSFELLGVRTAIFRNGLVLAADGGIISRLALPFRMGLGASIGTGNQYVPWIHIEDLCRIYAMAIENTNIRGKFNAVAPAHVNFTGFADILASAFHRKIRLPAVPAVLLKLAFGEMSRVILEGSRVSSEKIRSAGFQFEYSDLNKAFANIFMAENN